MSHEANTERWEKLLERCEEMTDSELLTEIRRRSRGWYDTCRVMLEKELAADMFSECEEDMFDDTAEEYLPGGDR